MWVISIKVPTQLRTVGHLTVNPKVGEVVYAGQAYIASNQFQNQSPGPDTHDGIEIYGHAHHFYYQTYNLLIY